MRLAPGLYELPERFRANAAELERLSGGAARSTARIWEMAANEVEAALRAVAEAKVSVAEAAEVSGYSAKHLRRMQRDGRLVDVSSEGEPVMYRVGDLPRKPSHSGAESDVVSLSHVQAARAAVRGGDSTA